MDVESQPLVPVSTQRVGTLLPIVIGTIALCFQIFVLYPWHIELSSQFADLQRVCKTV
jgi:hypothetical protein